MDAPQAFIVPSPSLDYLYHPIAQGWSIWEDHWLDNALQPLRGCWGIESVWLDCIE